jgi:MFS family permease
MQQRRIRTWSTPPDPEMCINSAKILPARHPTGMPKTPSERPDGLWSPERRALTVGLVLTITLVAFEALAVSTVLPIVAAELGNLQLYGWVFTSFFLGALIGIVVVGGAIDHGGLGRPFAVGLGLFAIGLLIGGLAPSMEVLVGARFIQGLGAGTIPPIAYVAIGRSLPERLRPRMFATLSTAWVLPGVIGPALAGVIGEFLGWRYVFLGLLPLIAVAGLLTIRAIRAVPAKDVVEAAEAAAAQAARRRLPYALLVATGAGLITVGLTSGNLLFTAATVVVGLAVGIPALRRLTPPGTLTARPVLPAAVLLRGVLTFTFFGVDAYVTLTLEGYRGLSAVVAGVVLTVATVSWTAGSWIQARGSERWSTDRFVRVGFLVVILGLASFSVILIPAVPVAWAVPTFAVAGLGMGLAYAPLSLIVLREAPAEIQGSASSALSLSDTLGTALGTGVSGAIIAASVRMTDGSAEGLAAAFGVAILVGIGGLLLTGRLRRSVEVAPSPALATSAGQTRG